MASIASSQTVRWWEKVEEPTTVWQALLTDDGLEYYVNTETNQTTWEKPEELMTPEEINAQGTWLWSPDTVNVYVPAKLISSRGKKNKVQREDGTEETVNKDQCMPCMRSWLQRVVPDLTLLDDMGAPLILHNLRRRFEEKSEIYTNVGNILISINPYKRLPLYTKEEVHRYSTRKFGQELPPHVFNIAYDSYYGLTSFQSLQSIIISGESGAGKTEATKQCLQYLAAVAGSRTGVENKILKANPVLEAFGNAKTIRNDNSSRFGKYIEIYFDGSGKICGSATENYLLEKIRVVQPAKDERNFHIFYQLIKAASPDLLNKLGLNGKTAKDFDYLKACTDVPTLDDVSDFKEVEDAFKELEFKRTDEEVIGLYAIVAAIMHLGNIRFIEGKPDEGKVSPTSIPCLEAAAKCLNVDKDTLGESLVTRTLRIRGSQGGDTKCATTPDQAASARDALCKFVYGRMFDWLISRVNKAMGGQKQRLYIGILDIFGFEIFKHNSFEQLCINFTNEMLQQHFNENTFKLEERVYNEEGIEWDHIDFIDNAPMIDLITKKTVGILPILDEELKVPQGSDKGFLRKLGDFQKKSDIFQFTRKDPMNFLVKHYAGEVEYDGRNFLDKNRDTLSADMVEMLQTSKHALVNVLYPPEESVSSSDRKSSLGKQFRGQLKELMGQLNRTSPHYIRCIKPNDSKTPLKFIPRNCYEQLTYSGVFEAVAIRKQGFPFRLRHKEFAERYCKITQGAVTINDGDMKSVCRAIIKHLKLNSSKNVQVGKSRVLYRAMEYRQLELDWSIINKNETITKNLARLVRVDHQNLSESEKEKYVIELADAVREADIFRVKSSDAEKGRALLERFVEERMDPKTKRLLSEAKNAMDRDKLETVLAHCDREGYLTKLVRECREMYENICDAEAAIAVATAQLREDFLEKALQMCEDFGYTAQIVERTKALLKALRKVRQGFKQVWGKAPKYNYKTLKKILKHCDENGLQNLSDYRDGITLYRKLEKARKILTAAYDAVDEAQLEKAVEYAAQKIYNGTEYKCQLQSDCKSLLAHVRKINKETEKALKQCIEDQVRVVVAAAKAINLKTKGIRKLRRLIEGPYSDFLEEQFNCAKKCKDDDRAIRVAVLRKNEMVADGDSSGLLDLVKFQGLKDPMNWAKEKWFGNKALLASRMLCFQTAAIHSPLTKSVCSGFDKDHVKLMKKYALNNFETVQKYMAQRNSTHMPQRLEELLTSCNKHSELRDEAYIAIMKQCTDNEKLADALPRALELLALCLTVFPPSPEFQDHLEMFIRRRDYKKYVKKTNAAFLLSRIVYKGPVAEGKVPKRGDYDGTNMHDGRKCKEHAAGDVLKSRLDLKKSVEPEYTRKNASWSDLRLRRGSVGEEVLKDISREW